jgi:hypothetical protein
MKLEDLLKKYVSEESPETEAKTEAEDGPQEQGHSQLKIRGDEASGKGSDFKTNGGQKRKE